MGFFLSFFFTDDFSLEPYFFQTMTPAQLSAGAGHQSVHHHLSELIFQMGENIMKKKINFPKI